MNIKVTKAQLEQLGRTIPKPKHIACKPRGQVIQLVSDYSRTIKQNTLTALLKKETSHGTNSNCYYTWLTLSFYFQPIQRRKRTT